MNTVVQEILKGGPRAFQFIVRKGALALEIKGMRHSSGYSAYALIKREYGYKGSRAKVLAAMQEDFNLSLTRTTNKASNRQTIAHAIRQFRRTPRTCIERVKTHRDYNVWVLTHALKSLGIHKHGIKLNLTLVNEKQ